MKKMIALVLSALQNVAPFWGHLSLARRMKMNLEERTPRAIRWLSAIRWLLARRSLRRRWELVEAIGGCGYAEALHYRLTSYAPSALNATHHSRNRPAPANKSTTLSPRTPPHDSRLTTDDSRNGPAHSKQIGEPSPRSTSLTTHASPLTPVAEPVEAIGALAIF